MRTTTLVTSTLSPSLSAVLVLVLVLGFAGLCGGGGCGPSFSDWIEVDRRILKQRVWPTDRVVETEIKHRLTLDGDRPTLIQIRLWEERTCAARIHRVYRPIYRRQKICGCDGLCGWSRSQTGGVRVQKGPWKVSCGRTPLVKRPLVVRVPLRHSGDASGERRRQVRWVSLPETTDAQGRVSVDLAPIFVGRDHLEFPDRVMLRLTAAGRKSKPKPKPKPKREHEHEHEIFLDQWQSTALIAALRPRSVKRTVTPGKSGTLHLNFGGTGRSRTFRVRVACPQAVHLRLQGTWRSLRRIHLRTGQGPALLRGAPVTLSCPAGGEVSLLLIREPCCAAGGTLSISATPASPANAAKRP